MPSSSQPLDDEDDEDYESEDDEGVEDDLIDEGNPESEEASPGLQDSPVNDGENQTNPNLRGEEEPPNVESPEEFSRQVVLPPEPKRLKTEPENNHN